MKTSDLLISMTAVLAFLQPLALAHAGERGGNGGGSIVCSDSSGAISKAFMLDLWEAANLPLASNGYNSLTIPSDPNTTFHDQLWHAIDKIDRAAPRHVSYFIADRAREIESQLAREVRSVKMSRISDSSDYAMPDIPGLTCEREQLANYSEVNGLVIRKAVWDALDETGKAALILHEAIYKTERDLAFAVGKNSDHTQELVAWAFSTSQIPPMVIGSELYYATCRHLTAKVRSLPAEFDLGANGIFMGHGQYASSHALYESCHIHFGVHDGVNQPDGVTCPKASWFTTPLFSLPDGRTDLGAPQTVCVLGADAVRKDRKAYFALYPKGGRFDGSRLRDFGSVVIRDADTGAVIFNGALKPRTDDYDNGHWIDTGVDAVFPF
jgi:hypothetical protein